MKIHFLKFIITIFTILIVFGCNSKDNNKIDSYIGFGISKDTIDNYLVQQMKELGIPGMSIAFINDREVVYHKTYGYANIQDSIKVNDKTIFEAASLSKPLFAYFVMKYVDEGKLDLDKPLYEYLPYPDIEDDERYKKITARMVLSHRSGFPNWRTDYPEKKLFISFDPGTDYLYSGEGYQYLAKVLKQIDNIDWDGLENEFQNKVAKPLGLEHTVFIQDNYAKKHKAEPYDKKGKWVNKENDPDRTLRDLFRAPASAHSEAIDFSKWLIALMSKDGLQKGTYREMFKVHSHIKELSYDFDVNYTLGFYNPDIPFTNIYTGAGDNLGFTSYFVIDTKKDWGFVLFTNSEYGDELGQNLQFYLLTGPNNMPKLYVIIGLVLVAIIITLILLIRFIIRKLKRQRGTTQYKNNSYLSV